MILFRIPQPVFPSGSALIDALAEVAAREAVAPGAFVSEETADAARVADLDALADQPAPVQAPPVVGIRVHLVGTGAWAREHETGRMWDVQEGYLTVDDEHDRTIAEYAPGQWCSVEDILAPAAEA